MAIPAYSLALFKSNTAGYNITLALVKTGAGSQTLSGNNNFTGGFVVNGGTLVLSAVNGSSPAGRGTLTITPAPRLTPQPITSLETKQPATSPRSTLPGAPSKPGTTLT